MTKQTAANSTLQELWAIKDQTAARFKSAADYFEYLQPKGKLPSGKAPSTSKPNSPARRSKVVSA